MNQRSKALRQKLILFTGPPCSGKSRLSTQFAQQPRVPLIEMDAVRLAILPQSAQSKEDRNTAYRAMHYMAELLFDVGVVQVGLVATYRPPEHRQAAFELVQRRGAHLFLIQCMVHPETAVRRFWNREEGHAAVDLTESSVREQARGYPYFADACTVDTTSMSPTEAVDLIREYILRGDPVNDIMDWVRLAV